MTDQDTIKDDLAFLKHLVSDSGRVEKSAGEAFLSAGVLFGAQCFLQYAQWVGAITPPPLLSLAFGVMPSLIFTAHMIYMTIRDRNLGPKAVGGRALSAAFTSAGLANLFIASAFGYVALKEKSMMIWMLYPIALCAFQGAVWYTAYFIRKRLWMAFASAGWFLASVGATFTIGTSTFLLILGVTIFFVMGGSGYQMIREAKAR